jgi:hypothetical protein
MVLMHACGRDLQGAVYDECLALLRMRPCTLHFGHLSEQVSGLRVQ